MGLLYKTEKSTVDHVLWEGGLEDPLPISKIIKMHG